jgi:hypothetical protein
MQRHKKRIKFHLFTRLTRRKLQKTVKYKWTLSSLTPSSRVRTKTTLLIPIRPRPNKQLAEAHLCGHSIDVSRVDFFLPGWLLTLISFSCDEIPVCVYVRALLMRRGGANWPLRLFLIPSRARERDGFSNKIKTCTPRESVTISSFRIFSSIPVSHHESIHPSIHLSIYLHYSQRALSLIPSWCSTLNASSSHVSFSPPASVQQRKVPDALRP